MPTRIALYAEANPTDPQCEIQLRHLREYSARQGGVLVREYVDIDAGRSASPPLRPSRGQLRKDAHAGHFDLICVWQLENWNCGSVFASLATIREFLSRGQSFVAVADQIHLERSNRDSQLVLSTLTACAAWERQARQRGVPVRSKGGAGHGPTPEDRGTRHAHGGHFDRICVSRTADLSSRVAGACSQLDMDG